jgi:hypothetical protein
MDHIEFWVIIYLLIGLAVYFTLPGRGKIPVRVTLPFILFWLVLSIVFMFGKDEEKQ